MKKGLQLVITLTFVCWAASAGAHSMWLNMDGNLFTKGQTVTVDIGWGHKFPKDGELKEGMLKEIVAIAPHGQRMHLKKISNTRFEFVPEEAGAYVICGHVHPGFVSRTTEGYKMGPKSDFEKAISCFHYDIRTRTSIRVGDPANIAVPGTGDPLEILPLENTFILKAGADFPVKVLFNGTPLAGASVCATYAGFSDKPNDFAQTVETAKDGTAVIKITHKGDWMISVTHEIPYPDPKECDTNKYNATMTVDVP
jgi:uncharacterized GH25 family protein